MVCRASLSVPLVEEADLRDARRQFESHVLRTSQPILKRYRFDLPPLNEATPGARISGGDAAPILVPTGLLAMQGR